MIDEDLSGALRSGPDADDGDADRLGHHLTVDVRHALDHEGETPGGPEGLGGINQ